MTKKLEELLNLPEIKKAMQDADIEEEYVTDDNEAEKGQLEMENLDQAQQQKEPKVDWPPGGGGVDLVIELLSLQTACLEMSQVDQHV